MKQIYNIYKIKPEEETKTFTISLNKGWDYLKVTHNTKKNFGWINIMSSYGDYSYIWGAMGKDTDLPTFFTKANSGYLVDKLFGSERKTFDLDKAISEIKKEVIKDRREGNMDYGMAREIFDFIEEELYSDISKERFADAMYTSNAIQEWYPEWWDRGWGMRYKTRFIILQDEIIPIIQEYFKGQLEEGDRK